MRTRSGRWAFPSIALAMAGAVLLGPATAARATLTLEAQETNGAMVVTTLVVQNGMPMGTLVPNAFAPGTIATTVGDSSPAGTIALGSLVTPITFGDFSVLGSVSTSNSPGAPTSRVTSSSLSVTNTTATAHTITLFISDNGFTTPTPPLLGATAGGTFSANPGSVLDGDAAHALAFANFANALFGTGLTVQDFSYATATDPTHPTTIASYSNNVPNSIAGPSTTPYSMTVELVFTVGGNNVLESRNDTITAVATPEPATLAMVFSALPLIGFAAWRKRRKSS